MKEWIGFAVAWVLLKSLGLLPRPFARAVAASIARVLLAMLPKFRRIAMFNLRIAFPDWTEERRQATIRNMARYLGWQAAEFARFPRYNRENIREIIEIEGHENFLQAQKRGQGVLI